MQELVVELEGIGGGGRVHLEVRFVHFQVLNCAIYKEKKNEIRPFHSFDSKSSYSL